MTPDHFLSKNSIGAWAVFFGGMPLCPDGTLDAAIRCAKHYKLPLTGQWWDGGACAWRPASELQDAAPCSTC